MIPLFFMIFFVMNGNPNVVSIMDYLNIISAIHSTLNTIVMIGTKKPYRDFLFQLPVFLKLKKRLENRGSVRERVSAGQVSLKVGGMPVGPMRRGSNKIDIVGGNQSNTPRERSL